VICGYAPPDFFEEPLYVSVDGFCIHISAGRAVATIPESEYSKDPDSVRRRFHDAVGRVFMGGQMAQNRPFQLNLPSVERDGLTGRRQVEHFGEIRATVSATAELVMVMTDETGKQTVVVDTRKERIERQARFATLIAKYTHDVTAQSLAASYAAAVRDQANELVHLYEVTDALMKRFNGKDRAIKLLGISLNDWSDLGRLSSHEPLRQGRHRGRAAGVLRDATADELARAREVARNMIEKYLSYLEASSARRENRTE
jgi:hypothetical protein